MQKFGKFICKYRKLILIITILIAIPAAIGMAKTKINYDILIYLPDNIETIQGENILTGDFQMGAYSIILVDNMPEKEMLRLEEEIRAMDSVAMVGSIADVLGEKIPNEMLPDNIRDVVYKENTTMIMVTFKEGMSSDNTMDTIEKIRKITDERCKISGMAAIILDTKNIFNQEFFIYVIIAVILCFIILELTLDSYVAPIFLLLNIGVAILYNMGTNIFLGQISYITKAISSVLQLGVTTDFAIFLYHSYTQEKSSGKNNEDAMASAIATTIGSVFGSSITTIAGFLALCGMNLKLGADIGIVMAKGVLFGVICVVTVLPAMILCFNGAIEKTKHKSIFPEFKHLKNFVMKHYKATIVIFMLILPFAFYGYKRTEIYYNLDSKLPASLESVDANKDLKEKFDMVSVEMILVDANISTENLNNMTSEINELDGIQWVLSTAKLSETGIPESMIPDSVLSKIETEKYKLVLVSSNYEMATDELNNQIKTVNKIIKKYDNKAILAGEGPLMNDLVEIADHDFNSVNTISIAIIFVIMLVILKSASLPFILMLVIEFAIFINMGIPYYTNTVLPFIASIVIGTIQLGATIDYAILITSKYIAKRKDGIEKKEAIEYALGTSIASIFTSGMCFFGATIGVGLYSKIEIISSICVLLGRGAIISMFSVIFALPAYLMVFDKLVCKTTIGLKKEGGKKNA
ncbi:MAG: MMPL family transporter [Clostridia bacterium]|nr:MMPL family transporter [Clostridia bacterium]